MKKIAYVAAFVCGSLLCGYQMGRAQAQPQEPVQKELILERLVITDEQGNPRMVLRTIEGRGAILLLHPQVDGSWTLVASNKSEREAVLDYLAEKK